MGTVKRTVSGEANPTDDNDVGAGVSIVEDVSDTVPFSTILASDLDEVFACEDRRASWVAKTLRFSSE